MVERRIKAAKFLATKSLDSFDFKAIPKLNKMQVPELARLANGHTAIEGNRLPANRSIGARTSSCRRHVCDMTPSGTGKTHIALGLGLAACQKGMSVSFTRLHSSLGNQTPAQARRAFAKFEGSASGALALIETDEY